MILGSEPNVKAGVSRDLLDRVGYGIQHHLWSGEQRHVDETFQQPGFGELLAIRETAKACLRLWRHPSGDERCSSHGCGVLNESRRQAILQIERIRSHTHVASSSVGVPQ